MKSKNQTPVARFLQDGGEMGALMRAHDWKNTSLGTPENWSQTLRTAVRIILNTGHPMYIFWGSAGICFYNDAYRQSIGAERHPSSLGKPARDVWEEIWPIIGPQIDQVMAGHGATWHENQLVPITRNGVHEDVYWTYSHTPIDDENAPNGVGGVLVVCSETTAQVVTSQRLMESEQRVQLALSAGNGVGTWDWDVKQNLVVADARFSRLYGVDPEKGARGAPITDFFSSMHPGDLPHVQASIDQALKKGGPFSSEYRLVQPNGDVRWVAVQGQCLFDSEGAPERFPGVSFDITERKHIEERLRRLNETLEAEVDARTRERDRIWQSSPDLMAIVDLDGRVVRTNPAWERLLGWTPEEIQTIPLLDLVHPDDVQMTRRAVAEFDSTSATLRFDNRMRTKEESYRWQQWVIVPEAALMYCVARDITEAHENEAALQAAQEALRQSQKMEAVGQLTGGLAHDFNNMLMGISGSLEMMQIHLEGERYEKLHRYIDSARQASTRAAALTHRLLAFSRRQTLAPQPTDVNVLVANLADMIRRTVGPSIEMTVAGSSDLVMTLVDPHQLENALLNLCINARDAMPDGGQLTIETCNKWLDEAAAKQCNLDTDHYVALRVSDTGVGMSQDTISHVFEPFFTTKPLGEGTGLGLSMVYGFARQSGGQVRIYSEEHQGTTMCVYLPRHNDSSPLAEDAREPPMPTHVASGQVVLVVDDEEPIRMLLAEVLEASGFTVLLAADGPQGLNVLQSTGKVDLLITDVGLPGGLNGRQVADAARILLPELKVLFITGYAENAVFESGKLERGMNVLTKPFAIAALTNKVQEMFDT